MDLDRLDAELKHLKNKLDDNIEEQKKTSLKQEVIDVDLKNKKLDKQEIETIKNLTDADKLLRDENILLKTSLETKTNEIDKIQIEMDKNITVIDQLRTIIAKKESHLEKTIRSEKLATKTLSN